jgi:flagellar biosynthetic protein FlhB
MMGLLAWDLQRFAGEKTERATPARRRRVRREGRVVRSAELTSAITVLSALAALRWFGPVIWGQWLDMMRTDLGHAANGDWSERGLIGLGQQQLWLLLRLLAPLLAVVLFLSLLAAFAQVGPGLWPKRLLPDLKRIDPFAGFKRLFSMRTLVEGVKSVLKLAIVAVAGYVGLAGAIPDLARLTTVDPSAFPGLVGDMAFRVAFLIAALMLGLGVLDYLYQRFDFERSIRMSLQEIKDEMKREEGDPLIKSTIRKRGRALAMRRMMQEVPRADVVVTNPTHLAVALRYDAATMAAPTVTAKGADEVARRIRQIAADHGVPVVEERPLAQALYRTVELGSQVPPQLYQAVAQVLAYVYRMRDERRGVTS